MEYKKNYSREARIFDRIPSQWCPREIWSNFNFLIGISLKVDWEELYRNLGPVLRFNGVRILLKSYHSIEIHINSRLSPGTKSRSGINRFRQSKVFSLLDLIRNFPIWCLASGFLSSSPGLLQKTEKWVKRIPQLPIFNIFCDLRCHRTKM